MRTPVYQITLTNGKYPKEYCCNLFTHMHVWRFNFWMHVKTQRGPLFYMDHMAHKWSKLFHCPIIDKTLES